CPTNTRILLVMIAVGMPVAQFITFCSASNLVETRCLSSPVQGASPAKTPAASRPSRAHGHHRRPATNCSKLSGERNPVHRLVAEPTTGVWLWHGSRPPIIKTAHRPGSRVSLAAGSCVFLCVARRQLWGPPAASARQRRLSGRQTSAGAQGETP